MNPPSTAQPNPKNISCACHWVIENGICGDDKFPESIVTQRIGKTIPARQARAKKGRKPTCQRGCSANFMFSLMWKSFTPTDRHRPASYFSRDLNAFWRQEAVQNGTSKGQFRSKSSAITRMARASTHVRSFSDTHNSRPNESG